MVEILSDIPLVITAGDSVIWEKTFSGYPANDGWSLEYALVNASNQITFSGAPSGASYRITLAAADTGGWVDGAYRYQAKLTKGDDTVTAETGSVTILADFKAATTGLDARPHCFIMRDALRALSEGKATSDQLSLSINNRSISKMAPAEVMEWLGHYEGLCIRHERRELARRGKPTGQKVKTRFIGS